MVQYAVEVFAGSGELMAAVVSETAAFAKACVAEKVLLLILMLTLITYYSYEFYQLSLIFILMLRSTTSTISIAMNAMLMI